MRAAVLRVAALNFVRDEISGKLGFILPVFKFHDLVR